MLLCRPGIISVIVVASNTVVKISIMCHTTKGALTAKTIMSVAFEGIMRKGET